MNTEIAELLHHLNNTFYRSYGSSFASTRQAPWVGWKHCLEVVRGGNPEVFGGGSKAGKHAFSVFDVACGNLRFEQFLCTEFPDTKLALYAMDNCDDLVGSSELFKQRNLHYQSFDVITALLQGSAVADVWEAPPCDLVVSFGFLHHVPQAACRQALLEALIDKTLPGGFLVVSLWQFLHSPTLAKKAYASHKRACDDLGLPPLDEGDYILGWMNVPGAYRYCHSFSEAEIDSLVAAVATRALLVDRFSAEGKANNLNAYLVLRVV